MNVCADPFIPEPPIRSILDQCVNRLTSILFAPLGEMKRASNASLRQMARLLAEDVSSPPRKEAWL